MKLLSFVEFIYENTSSNFIRWFGNSKVIDNNGKPLIVYHGSTSEFDEFIGDGYFSDDYYNADGYANGEYVYEVYLNISNPLIIDCKNKKWDDLKTKYGTTTQKIVRDVDRTKFDGIIFKNIKDNWIDDVDYQEPSTVYVTFLASQIKSVENDGSWDKNNNNIYL